MFAGRTVSAGATGTPSCVAEDDPMARAIGCTSVMPAHTDGRTDTVLTTALSAVRTTALSATEIRLRVGPVLRFQRIAVRGGADGDTGGRSGGGYTDVMTARTDGRTSKLRKGGGLQRG
jgi:hypothetical protein